MPNIPHEYGCEDCDLMYHGIPVITETGEVLCANCAADRAELIETDPYEFDDDYGDTDLFGTDDGDPFELLDAFGDPNLFGDPTHDEED